jgi:hypothetical protein
MTELSDTQLTLRRDRPEDDRALIRLAQRDSGRPPPGPLLLAFAGDRLVAAISLADGGLIADPFEPTAGIADMLRARARQLGGDRRRGPFRRLRPAAGRLGAEGAPAAQPSGWRIFGRRVAATSSRRRTGVV